MEDKQKTVIVRITPPEQACGLIRMAIRLAEIGKTLRAANLENSSRDVKPLVRSTLSIALNYKDGHCLPDGISLEGNNLIIEIAEALPDAPRLYKRNLQALLAWSNR